MCFHKWGEWQEFTGNLHPWSHPKFQIRMCLRCNKEEKRIMPSLEERLIEIFEKGHTEQGIEECINYLKRSYGVARTTRTIKDLVRF